MRLETDRLVLRPLSMDDLDVLGDFYADPETMRYIGEGATLDREQSRASLERMLGSFAAQGFGQLGVVRKEDGALVGRCGLLVWNPESWTPVRLPDAESPVEIEVGYLLGREFWGRGYATEAASAVRDHAFHELGVQRLIALIRPGNDASARVAEKLGMRHEGDVVLMEEPARLFALEP